MRPVWEATSGRDGHVSLAIDPWLEPLRAQVDRLVRLVARRNLLVAIPATEAGLEAIEDSVAAGISVDATTIFSPTRLEAAVEAYLRGVERLVENGGDPRLVAAVASVSVSHVDAEVDGRLEALGEDAHRHRGRLGIASAKLAHRRCAPAFAGRRWQALAAAGATRQRCLWTSTSTSGTAYRDVLYAEQLIGADTIVALTPGTIAAFEDHGVVADQLSRCAGDAPRVLRDVAAAGVDLDEVSRTLEAEGARRLATDFDRVAARVAQRADHPDR
jgi:transaldolase